MQIKYIYIYMETPGGTVDLTKNAATHPSQNNQNQTKINHPALQQRADLANGAPWVQGFKPGPSRGSCTCQEETAVCQSTTAEVGVGRGWRIPLTHWDDKLLPGERLGHAVA